MLAILHCLAFIDRTMIGGVLPLIRHEISMTDAAAGWIIGTAFALPYGATALAIAALLRGRRASSWWLVVGVALWTTGSIATGAAGSIGELTAARALIGIGQGMFVPVAIARLLDSAGHGGRARALASFTSGSTIGRSVALVTTGSLLSLLALVAQGSGVALWRWLFVVTALPNVVMLVLLATTPGATGASPPKSDREAIDWRILVPFFAVAIMPVLLIQAIGGWLPTLFVRDHGLAPGRAALLLGLVGLVAAPMGQCVAGWLMGRYPGWHARLPAIVLGGLVATLVPLAGIVWSPGLAGAVAWVAVATVTIGIASFCGLFGVQLLIPPGERISVNGIYLAFVTLVAVGAGPLLTGVLATATGGGAASLGRALLVTGAIACGLCALAVAAADAPYRRHSRA